MTSQRRSENEPYGEKTSLLKQSRESEAEHDRTMREKDRLQSVTSQTAEKAAQQAHEKATGKPGVAQTSTKITQAPAPGDPSAKTPVVTSTTTVTSPSSSQEAPSQSESRSTGPSLSSSQQGAQAQAPSGPQAQQQQPGQGVRHLAQQLSLRGQRALNYAKRNKALVLTPLAVLLLSILAVSLLRGADHSKDSNLMTRTTPLYQRMNQGLHKATGGYWPLGKEEKWAPYQYVEDHLSDLMKEHDTVRDKIFRVLNSMNPKESVQSAKGMASDAANSIKQRASDMASYAKEKGIHAMEGMGLATPEDESLTTKLQEQVAKRPWYSWWHSVKDAITPSESDDDEFTGSHWQNIPSPVEKEHAHTTAYRLETLTPHPDGVLRYVNENGTEYLSIEPSATAYLSGMRDSVSGTAKTLSGRGRDAANRAKHLADEALGSAEQGAGYVRGAANKVKRAVGQAASKASGAATSAKDAVGDAAHRAGEMASDAAYSVKSKLGLGGRRVVSEGTSDERAKQLEWLNFMRRKFNLPAKSDLEGVNLRMPHFWEQEHEEPAGGITGAISSFTKAASEKIADLTGTSPHEETTLHSATGKKK